MILHGIGKTFISSNQIYDFYPISSIWTIDIAYLLKHYGVEDFTFYTLHIGVNWSNAQVISSHYIHIILTLTLIRETLIRETLIRETLIRETLTLTLIRETLTLTLTLTLIRVTLTL